MKNSKNLKCCEFSFKILFYLGLWRASSLKSLWAIRLYNFGTIILILHKSYYITTFLIFFLQTKGTSEMYIESFFLFTSGVMLVFKLAYFNYHRQDVNYLLKLFLRKENLPRNVEENLIYKQFQTKERFIERIFVSSTLLTIGIMTLSLLNKKHVSSAMKRWNPYTTNSETSFWMNYIYDSITANALGLAYASMDSLLVIFVLRICTHLDIFMNRLLKIQNIRQNTVKIMNVYQEECNVIKNCVNHHLRIFEMEKSLNDVFSLIIFFHFFITILNLCSSCFCLIEVKLSNERCLFVIASIICLITETFIYCYVGEKLVQRSLSISDEIYKMDWTALKIQTKEKLMLMMMRSNKPMQLTGGSFINLSIDTFLKVVKASYSSFNLLRQTK